jgi:hypothetical protein
VLLNYGLALPDAVDIDYIKTNYSKLANSELLMRLAGAISKRRIFIRYCRDQRSQQETNEISSQDAAATDTLSINATVSSISKFPNSNFDLENEELDNSSSASAPTMANYRANLLLPRLVDLSPALQTFECPICFTSQTFEDEKSWL